MRKLLRMILCVPVTPSNTSSVPPAITGPRAPIQAARSIFWPKCVSGLHPRTRVVWLCSLRLPSRPPCRTHQGKNNNKDRQRHADRVIGRVVVFRIAVAVCGNEPASLAPRFSLGAWLVLARDGWQIFLRPADAMARPA